MPWTCIVQQKKIHIGPCNKGGALRLYQSARKAVKQIRVRQHGAVGAAALMVIGSDHVQHIRRQKPALPAGKHVRTDPGLKLDGASQHVDQFQFLMPMPWDTAVRVQIQIIQIHLHGKCRRAVAGYFLQISIYFQIV